MKLTERTITTSLILQLCALFLMSPASTATLGDAIYAACGQYNLDTWIGHCLDIAAAGMIGVNVSSRLDISHADLRRYFSTYFALPMSLVVPISLALIVKSPNADHRWPDLFNCPLDGWLAAYWVLVCGFIAYVLGIICWPLIILRRCEGNRLTATLYLVGCTLAVGVCLGRIVTIDATLHLAPWFWTGDSLIGIVFAVASSQCWKQKTKRQDPARL